MLKVTIALAFLALNLFLTPTIAISFLDWFTDYTPPGFWQTAGLLQMGQTLGLLALWGIGYLVSLGVPA